MRKFQLSINLHYLNEDNRPVVLDVYTDSNNILETICAGFSELVGELQETGEMELPSFGARESRWHWSQ